MSLTNLEKETIIVFNEAEDTANVETFSARLLGQLRKVESCEGVVCKTKEKGYGVYVLPKTMVKVIAPRKQLVLTDEQRDHFVEWGKRTRAEQLKNKNTLSDV